MSTISTIPLDAAGIAASLLSPKDAAALSETCKAMTEAVKDAQLLYHYPAILSFDPATFLGRIVQEQRQKLTDNNDGRVELVKRVRQTATAYIDAHRRDMEPEDWKTMEIASLIPSSDLSFRELNIAGTVMKDRLLLKNIDIIFPDHQIPLEQGSSLSKNAKILRNWLAHIPIDTDPVRLGSSLNQALDIGNFQVVQAILQNKRAINPEKLGWALYKAVATSNLELVQSILQSEQTIDPEKLGLALSKAVETENLEVIQSIIRSGRAIDPVRLGWVLREAAEARNLEIVRAIQYLDGSGVVGLPVKRPFMKALDR